MKATQLLRRTIGTVLVTSAVVALSQDVAAETKASRAYMIKAAFLYDMVKSTLWPRSTGTALDFCVYGDNPFGNALDLIDGQPVADRKLKVRSLSSIDGIADCDVIFVGNFNAIEVKTLLREANRQSALTVSEMPNFIENGGMVRLKEVNNRLRFEVNALAMQQTGLIVSVDALELADSVNVGAAGPAQLQSANQ